MALHSRRRRGRADGARTGKAAEATAAFLIGWNGSELPVLIPFPVIIALLAPRLVLPAVSLMLLAILLIPVGILPAGIILVLILVCHRGSPETAPRTGTVGKPSDPTDVP